MTQFQANFAGAYAFGGFVGGITKEISTTAYMDSVLTYTHARLSDSFDRWLDNEARTTPRELQHVYEWPSTYQQYRETVGIPKHRLWKHTLTTNRSRTKAASFEFLPSTRPSPVDPILLKPGPTGKSVKQNVHIFVWKATAMEYGMDITVTPKMAKYLAYVGRMSENGYDEGWSHASDNEDGSSVNFSSGPVHFTAGGDTTYMKFTSAYTLWWSTMASSEFDRIVAPRLEHDLVNRAKLDSTIQMANRKRPKNISIMGQASGATKDWDEAAARAITEVKAKEIDYISEARIRRFENYGY